MSIQSHLENLRKSVYPEKKMDYHERLIDQVFDKFVSKMNVKSVLDVGFGTGYTLEKFKKIGVNPIGITLDPSELQAALLLKYEVYSMGMEELTFDNGRFDLVWCRHSLEHSPMPLIALMEFNRVLGSGGFMYVEVPEDNCIQIENKNHYSLFSDGMWQQLFMKAGFRIYHRGEHVIRHPGQDASWTDLMWYYWMKKA